MTTVIRQKPTPSAAGLYRTIYRWHFYAGVFCIPFIVMLAITGTIYLFKPQIDQFNFRHYQKLAVSGERASANAQIEAAVKAVPGSRFFNYQLPQAENEAVVISVNNGERILVYLNPFTLEVLNVVPFESQFTRVVRTLHGELLAGNVGSVLVELAGCWAIVLIVSGLYLWWPRGAKGLGGVLYPRLGQGGRVFWRDLHCVTGIWISAFTLLLLITGLPWALVWGAAFKEVRQWGSEDVIAQDWSAGRADEHHTMHTHHAASDEPVNLSPALLAQAQALSFAPPVELTPLADTDQWKLSSEHQDRTLRGEAWLSSNGEVIRRSGFADKAAIDRVIGIGVSAHEGQLFGWFNQLLGVLTTSGLLLICVSGFIMWRRRKPSGVLGAPSPVNARAGKVAAAVVLIMAIVLPLLAMSLLVLLLLEQLLLKHFPAGRVWLGLNPH